MYKIFCQNTDKNFLIKRRLHYDTCTPYMHVRRTCIIV